jgi:hypothetical protein
MLRAEPGLRYWHGDNAAVATATYTVGTYPPMISNGVMVLVVTRPASIRELRLQVSHAALQIQAPKH